MRALTVFLTLVLLGCTSSCLSTGPACDTPERCKAAACVNSGCRFDDAGVLLEGGGLTSRKAIPAQMQFQSFKLGEKRSLSFSRRVGQFSTECSHDELGAGFVLTVEQSRKVRVRLKTSNQVSLALVKVDETGHREVEKCVRSFSPELKGVTLVPGRWEFVVTGSGTGSFEVFGEPEPLRMTLSTGQPDKVYTINPNQSVILDFVATGSVKNKVHCSNYQNAYLGHIKLSKAAKLQFSLSSPQKDLSIGLASLPLDGAPDCAPPMNQSIVRSAAAGDYLLLVETNASRESLERRPWVILVGTQTP